jgi:hypothetical protein
LTAPCRFESGSWHQTQETAVKTLQTSLIFLLSISAAIAAPIEDPKLCAGGDRAVTAPAPVDAGTVLQAMEALKTADGKPAFVPSVENAKNVRDIFDTTKVKTKMEQFYSLLHLIARNLPESLGSVVTLDAAPVRNVLLQSKVFRNPALPNRIQEITIERYDREEPKYIVAFDGELIRLPLNDGAGFNLFRNGLCQHAAELIFRNKFSFKLKRLSNGNLEARHFQGVDLFGDFGNRGVVDVDINYVELRAVEFYRGTQDGKVTAYVSDEEFKKNSHNFLLRLVTKFVPDRSVQPIDW